MAADKFFAYAAAVLAIFATMSLSSAELAQKNPDLQIRKILEENLSRSIVELEKTVATCNKKAIGRAPRALDDGAAFDGKKRDAVLLGISYFYFKNMFDCEKYSRSVLAYDLSMLIALRRSAQMGTDDLEQIKATLVLQPIEQLTYQVQFDELDADLKRMLAQRLGDAPFELQSTLAANGFSSD